ncbi:farnesoate epoxidase isoform X2 [Folsomia candida]|nr:farnesoate epoxidase isoform X2 [Folsomia candida]
MFSLKFGPYNCVVLNDPKLIKEAWNNYQLCGRPKLSGSSVRTGGTVRGILFQDGLEWIEQRRFALRHLRDFGFGKKSMEHLVLDEISELVENLKKDAGRPISTQNRFNIAVLNSLWRIVSGQRFSHDDKQLGNIMESINNSLNAPAMGLMFFFPWIKDFAPNVIGWNKYVEVVLVATNFVSKYVKERLQVLTVQEEPQDFIDVYINEIKTTGDAHSSFYGKRGEETMVGTLLDLFVAGAETTSTTLTYFFLYMALFPEKQGKVAEEIERIVGSRHPMLNDRDSMPYTEATIMETLRFSSMVPLGIFHRALEDTELGNQVIPKDTFVVANFATVHRSPEIWSDPDNFRPERFLSEDGLGVIKNDSLMPFSYGKRLCLGESLAKDELFLFTTSLLQQFSVGPDPTCATPLTSEQICANIISHPKPHNLVFSLRN